MKASIFDPDFEPMTTAKSPQGGKDIVQSSANSFYGPGVTLADLKDFKAKYPLNSRVVKQPDGSAEGRDLSRGHAGWLSASGTVCHVSKACQ